MVVVGRVVGWIWWCCVGGGDYVPDRDMNARCILCMFCITCAFLATSLQLPCSFHTCSLQVLHKKYNTICCTILYLTLMYSTILMLIENWKNIKNMSLSTDWNWVLHLMRGNHRSIACNARKLCKYCMLCAEIVWVLLILRFSQTRIAQIAQNLCGVSAKLCTCKPLMPQSMIGLHGSPPS